MLLLKYAKQRLQAFLDEVARVGESEFPYPDPEQAVIRIQQLFEKKLARLKGFDPDADEATIRRECSLSLQALTIPINGNNSKKIRFCSASSF